MRDNFERAILENPDDVAGYAAYADWLQEQGDPRGEFIQVQLALEDEKKPAAQRKKLRAREKSLLKAHEREWLGDLAPHLLGPEPESEYPAEPVHRWHWGFLEAINARYLTLSSAQALATAPAARLLRELRVGRDARDYGMDEGDQPPARVRTPRGERQHWELFELIGSPNLANLRVFQMGDEEPPEDGWSDCHTYALGLEHVIASMPRVEELHLICKGYNPRRLFGLANLTRLRVLRIYALGNPYAPGGPAYPLDVLVRNRVLGNLTHLLLHPHYNFDQSFLPLDQVRFVLRSKHLTSLTHLQLRLSDMGDDGVREIVGSGILKRLKVLDLRHGCVTDDGARLFAACADARNLERLDLSRNAVTAAGLRALKAAGIKAVANQPLTRAELDAREFLHEGDFE